MRDVAMEMQIDGGGTPKSAWEIVRDLEQNKGLASQQIQQLLAENAELKRKADAYDELKKENEELQQDVKRHEAALDNYEAHPKVSMDDYTKLMTRFQDLQATHQRNMKQAGHYKAAYARIASEKEELKRRLAENKGRVKGWQTFAEGSKARSDEKGSAGPSTPMPPPMSSLAAAGATPNDAFITPSARYTLYNNADRVSILNPRAGLHFGAEAGQDKLELARSMPVTSSEPGPIKTSADIEEPRPDYLSLHDNALDQVSRLHGTELNNVKLRGSSGETSPTRQTLQGRAAGDTSRKSSSSATTIVPQDAHDEVVSLSSKHARRTLRPATFVPPFIHATQTTERDTIREGSPPAVQTHYHLPENESSPVIVSTRTIKRRRIERDDRRQDQTSHRSQLDDGGVDLEMRPRVKDDPDAEGFTRVSVARLQAEHSIDDLDTIHGIVLTPKKRNALQRVRSNSHSQQSVHGRWLVDQGQFRSSSVPMVVDEAQNLSMSFRDKLDRRSPMDARTRVKDEDGDVIVLDHDDDLEMPDSPSQHIQSRILQPISTNVRTILPVTSNPPSARKFHRHAEPSRIAGLAEDGAQYVSDRKRAAEATPNKSSRTPRIMNMLEGTSAQKQVLRMSSQSKTAVSPRSLRVIDSPRDTSTVSAESTSRRAAPSARANSLHKHDTPTMPKESRSTRAASSTRSASPRKHEARPRSPRKHEARRPRLEIRDTFDDDNELREEVPLRSKPLESLTISDFRINPKYNQGLDYAFSEVIRESDKRQCLPGCTRPDCCGSKFRKMIEIGGALPDRGPGLWDENSKSGDQRILERYLGSDAMKRVKRMSPQEVQEMLLKARAENMAQQHGKHKSSWVRSSTPPGFWNADFPSTQEEEENRRKAAKMERDRIAEMRREAVRGDGKWLFKDE